MPPRVVAAVPPRAPATAADRATNPSPDGNPVRENPAPAATGTTPVIARAERADGSARARTPVRPGLGEPLGELPATARQMGSTASIDATAPAPAREAEAPPLTVMRRVTDAEESRPTAATSTSTATSVGGESGPTGSAPSRPGTAGPKPTTRAGLGAPLRELPPTATRTPNSTPTPAAPLLGGAPVAQRSTAPTESASPARPGNTPSNTPSAPMDGGVGQQTPVRPHFDTPVVPATSPADPRPEPLVPVSRAVGTASPDQADSGANTPATGAPKVERPTAGGSIPVPAVQRSRRLLADRPLVVSTGAAEGFSAPAPTPGAGSSRPVVAATWRRDPVQPTSRSTATPAQAPSAGGRTAPGPAPVQRADQRQDTPQVQRSSSKAPRQTTTPTYPTPSPRRGLMARLRPAAPDSPSAPNAHDLPTRQAPRTATTPVDADVARTRPATPAPTPPSHPPTPAAPIQRSSTPAPVRPAPSAANRPAPAPTPAAVPLVRLDPQGSATTRPGSGDTSAPVQRLAQPMPLTTATGPGAPAVGAPRLGPEPSRGQGANRPDRLQAKAVQRMADAGLGGIPVTPVARAVDSSTRTNANATAATPTSAAGPAKPAPRGAELDELARHLLDPVARLLRAEMRRGRERTGRPYDGRR
ncbi:hypothetical protein ACFWAC_21250 [Streptomyces sp. NPDC059885]